MAHTLDLGLFPQNQKVDPGGLSTSFPSTPPPTPCDSCPDSSPLSKNSRPRLLPSGPCSQACLLICKALPPSAKYSSRIRILIPSQDPQCLPSQELGVEQVLVHVWWPEGGRRKGQTGEWKDGWPE